MGNIKNQLSAIKNIKQITTSMEMVASARFRKAQDKARQSQFYISKMQEILKKLSAASTDTTHPLFIQKKIDKIGLVIVSSDRGLCGAYNSSIFSAADQFLSTQSLVELTLLGKKAFHYYRSKKWKIQNQILGWSGKIKLQQIQELSNALIKRFLEGDVSSIFLLYTKFHHLMHREVVLEQFLPLGRPKKHSQQEQLNYLFEPNVEEIYNQILPRYCLIKFETMINEAYASELVARIFSMKAAAKNAEERVEELTLEMNKMRQAGITREISETISAINQD